MVLVVLWVDNREVLGQQVVREPRELKKLPEVSLVIYAGKDFFKVSQSVLFLFKIENYLHIIVRQLLINFSLYLLNESA